MLWLCLHKLFEIIIGYIESCVRELDLDKYQPNDVQGLCCMEHFYWFSSICITFFSNWSKYSTSKSLLERKYQQIEFAIPFVPLRILCIIETNHLNVLGRVISEVKNDYINRKYYTSKKYKLRTTKFKIFFSIIYSTT